MKAKLILLLAVATFACTDAGAQSKYPKNLFSTSQMRVDSVRAPHGLDWYLQSREARVIAAAIAAYMGVDPTYVALATEVIPTARQDGEETYYDLPVAPGYVFCAARIGVRSIVPSEGGRASVINAVGGESSVGVYTWTPVRGLGEVRAWVEAYGQVTGIRPAFLAEFRDKGVCRAPGQRIFECRGNPCAGAEWGSIQEAGPSTPDLTQGF